MEYADAGDLHRDIIIRQTSGENGGPQYFSENEIYTTFAQICLGVKYIHDRRIIHRDLKAENIFMTKGGIAKIGDMGICKVCETDSTGCKTKVGTPIIMSPE
jgi:NIMA (never in mitosis gene a)-related kinase 1/4/5